MVLIAHIAMALDVMVQVSNSLRVRLLIDLMVLIGIICYVKSCGEDEFTCSNGQCIQSRYLCDQSTYFSCDDRSDETCWGCNQTVQGSWKCSNGQCIKATHVCDGGAPDCDDGSDETTYGCGIDCWNYPGGGFACSNGECIQSRYLCDQSTYFSCDDRSDETPWGCFYKAYLSNNLD